MTLNDALKLDPGPELNAVVAEHVMGWRRGTEEWSDGSWLKPNGAGHYCLLTGYTIYDWSPSTDYSDAMLVATHLCHNGLYWQAVAARLGEKYGFEFYGDCPREYTTANTFCLALVRAALSARLKGGGE